MLDELERSLLEIVHGPSTLTPAELQALRVRLDAAALLFKVRVLHDELRGRETRARQTETDHMSTGRTTAMTRTTTRAPIRPIVCATLVALHRSSRPRAPAPRRSRRFRCSPPTISPPTSCTATPASSIDEGHYDKAVEQFTRLASRSPSRADAALYWKAYSLAKLGQRADALTTLADLERRFADSRWVKDAKALEVEVRQASGQAVSPDSQNDEELKLLALRGLMQSDPDRGLPFIEKMLDGDRVDEGQGAGALRPQPEPVGQGARDHQRRSRRDPAIPTSSSGPSAISGSWAARTTARSSPTSTTARPTRR